MKKLELERTKLLLDYLKHLITLSTGSIVLITIFLENIFKQPLHKHYVVFALGGFLLTILGCLIAHTTALLIHEENSCLQNFGILGLILTWLGLIIGLGFLSLFAVINLW